MNWSRNLNVDRPAGRIGRVAQVFFGSLVCVLLAACAPPAGQGSPSQSESSSTLSPVVSPATPTPTVPQTSEPTGPSSVLVYFVTETPTGPRLARELRGVSGDARAGAVQAMINGPSDPDYTTFWDPATSVLSTSTQAGVVTVELNSAARNATVDKATANLMVQQLVFTATMDDPNAKVQLLIDGEVAGGLWGTTSWDQPIGRGDAATVLAAVLTDRPANGSRLTSDNASFSGEVLAGSTLAWAVRHAGTSDEAAAGEVQANDGEGFVPFSITPELGPGRFVLELRAYPADGDPNTPLAIDTREFSFHLAA